MFASIAQATGRGDAPADLNIQQMIPKGIPGPVRPQSRDHDGKRIRMNPRQVRFTGQADDERQSLHWRYELGVHAVPVPTRIHAIPS